MQKMSFFPWRKLFPRLWSESGLPGMAAAGVIFVGCGKQAASSSPWSLTSSREAVEKWPSRLAGC